MARPALRLGAEGHASLRRAVSLTDEEGEGVGLQVVALLGACRTQTEGAGRDRAWPNPPPHHCVEDSLGSSPDPLDISVLRRLRAIRKPSQTAK